MDVERGLIREVEGIFSHKGCRKRERERVYMRIIQVSKCGGGFSTVYSECDEDTISC